VAIREASGDIVILTCPEMYHLNKCIDLIVEPLLKSKKLISIPQFIYFDDRGLALDKLKKNLPIKRKLCKIHHQHNRMPFLMGIWKKELISIGGYDEDFIGYANEDNDLMSRLLANHCFYFQTKAEVIHLYHGERCPDGMLYGNEAWAYNRKLLDSRKGQIVRNKNKKWGDKTNMERKTIQQETMPKILHLYWDDNQSMSYLQTMTVTTFHKHNPDWQIKCYVPEQRYTRSAKYIPDYTGKDMFFLVKELPYVDVIRVDLDTMDIDKDIHNILRSDIFRYKILYKEGGLWSDFDILWLRPITALNRVKYLGKVTPKDMGTCVCRFNYVDGHNNIAVILSKPKHPLYKAMVEETERILKNNKNRDLLTHQVFGTDLLDKMFDNVKQMQDIYPDVVAFPYRTFYPYSIFKLEELYKKNNLSLIDDDVLCIHWFNGADASKEYCNNLDLDILKNREASCLIDRFVKQYI
jgi:hypothetical protein